MSPSLRPKGPRRRRLRPPQHRKESLLRRVRIARATIAKAANAKRKTARARMKPPAAAPAPAAPVPALRRSPRPPRRLTAPATSAGRAQGGSRLRVPSAPEASKGCDERGASVKLKIARARDERPPLRPPLDADAGTCACGEDRTCADPPPAPVTKPAPGTGLGEARTCTRAAKAEPAHAAKGPDGQEGRRAARGRTQNAGRAQEEGAPTTTRRTTRNSS